MNYIINESLKEIKSLIQDKIANRWMDIKEVSEFTSVSASTIRRAVRSGRLKASNSTGKLLFRVSDIDHWLNG